MALDDIGNKIKDAWHAATGDSDVDTDTKPEKEGEELETEQEEPEHWTEARNDGWMPLEEWKEAEKDPEEWKPAKAYINDGKIREDLRKVKRALKKRDKQVDTLIEERQHIADRSYKKAVEDLKNQRKKAADDGNLDVVLEISDKLEELKEAEPTKEKMDKSLEGDEGQQVEIKLTQDDEEQLQSWGQKNQWYVQNPRLRAFHEAVAEEHLSKGASIVEAFELAGQEVKKTFPAQFRGRKAAGSVISDAQTTGSRPSRSTQPRVLRPNELPEDVYGLYQNYRKLGMFKKNQEDKNGKWTYDEWARTAGLIEG